MFDTQGQMKKIPVAAVVGPTAAGKTKLAVELCKRFNGEVVSADSMQIYIGLDIATAKPTTEEQGNVPHHMIGFLPVTESFSVADYCEKAAPIIADIAGRGKLPVVAGGTGLYIDSLINNIEFSLEKADVALRDRLKARARNDGNAGLLSDLAKIDPSAAAGLHPNDTGRIIRAIELFNATGKTMEQRNRESRMSPSPYEVCLLGLFFRDRQNLYDRINKRVDTMMKNGLLEEAEAFLRNGCPGTSQQAIGYKELAPFYRGEIHLDEAVERLKRETRRYAKRQLTWFGKNKDTNRIYVDDYADFNGVVKEAVRIVAESGLIAG